MSDELSIASLDQLAKHVLAVADGEGWSAHDQTRKLANMARQAAVELATLRTRVAWLEAQQEGQGETNGA